MAGRPVVFDFIARDRNYTGPVRKMEGTTTRFGATIGRVGGVALRAFGGVGVAAAGLGVGAVTLGLKTEAGLEQARIAFKHLLGGAKEADSFLKQLVKFAADTPFELPGVEQAAQLLLGAGESARKILPDLRAIGDAASTSADPTDAFNRSVLALSQSMGKGKLQAEEIQQVVEAGIPLWRELSRATGLPVPKLQDMASKGQLLTKDVLPKLFDQMNKDYGGAMAEQSTTLNGVWSTFKDTVSNSLAQVMVPLSDMLKNILPTAGKAASDFVNGTLIPAMRTAKTWWDDNKTSVGALATILKETFVPATDDTKTSIGNLSTAADTLNHKLTGLFIAAGSLIQWWTETRISTTELMSATYSLIIALGHAANGIGLITGAGRHAGDSLIAFGEDGKRVAENDLAKLREQLRKLKEELDRLRHPNIDVTASLALHFSKSFTQQDWAQVKVLTRGATGGLVRGPGGPTADRVPALLSAGEFVVNAKAVQQIGVANMRRLNDMRFATGGPVGTIGREARDINRLQAKGTGIWMDRGLTQMMASFGGGAFTGGAASGNVIRLALAQAKRMAASFKVALALMEAGIVESGLRNLNYGDRDSLGFLQQRPSQGWAHPMNISYASWDFLRRAIPIQGRYGTAGQLAQAVQRSAFPGRYNQQQARALGILHAYNYDRGGGLRPGLTLAMNNTGRTEPVGIDYGRLADAIVGAMQKAGVGAVYLDATRVDRVLDTAHLRNDRLRGGISVR